MPRRIVCNDPSHERGRAPRSYAAALEEQVRGMFARVMRVVFEVVSSILYGVAMVIETIAKELRPSPRVPRRRSKYGNRPRHVGRLRYRMAGRHPFRDDGEDLDASGTYVLSDLADLIARYSS